MSLTFALIVVILATIVVSVAFIAGILTQVTRLPKLIFYILAGMILGPIGFGLIQPAFVLMMEGQLLQAVVALAVAIIVFEGGYNFNRCLPHEQACAPISFRMLLGRILRLSLIGGFITIVFMTLLFFFVAQFPLNLALLVGALTMITGPTVINPCVRQLGIKEEVGFTLEGEGLVNDALGVIIASVIFSAILAETVGSVFILPLQIIYNLSIGILAGLTISGLGIFISIYVAPRFFASLGDRCDEVNRAQLTRIAMLIAAFSAYGLAEFFAPEAGIVSVLIAGILIGNRDRFSPEDVDTWDEEAAPQTLKDHIEAGVHAFQSDLVKLAIATVFILLTTVVTRELLLSALVFASVPFAGLIIVTALILVVRPLGVVVSTIGTSFTWRERLFMSFFGPRGIVIAAAGVFFYLELLAYGISFEMIPAYIFLIVFATVVIQAGLSPYTARACKVCVRD